MLIIHHRRNTLELLSETPRRHGVEVDVRSYGSKLVVHHDPFTDAVAFEEWLEGYNHQFLILNTKEEGLEDQLLGLMSQRGINDFFFLDQSFPFLIKTAKSGESRCAVRVSEYESIETALSLAGMVGWIWIDTFTRFPLSGLDVLCLKEAGFRLCLVSPELQGYSPAKISEIQELLNSESIVIDAVCTKLPDKWTT